MARRRPKIDTRELARLVFVRDGGCCFYCGENVSLEARAWLVEDQAYARRMFAATFDHIIPRSRGGKDEVDNGVCACAGCNEERSDRPAVDFLYEKLQRRGLLLTAVA